MADAGDILGTLADRFDNDDKYLLHVNNRIREYIGLEFVSFINFQLVPVEDKKYCSSNVSRRLHPFSLKPARMKTFMYGSDPAIGDCRPVRC